MLRIDVNGRTQTAATGSPRRTRSAGASALTRDLRLGVRNPWRFSFDRARGDLWIGDVGQNQIEEIDFAPLAARAAANFGWKRFEGRSRFSDVPPRPAG